jgi:hypothetical protein
VRYGHKWVAGVLEHQYPLSNLAYNVKADIAIAHIRVLHSMLLNTGLVLSGARNIKNGMRTSGSW